MMAHANAESTMPKPTWLKSWSQTIAVIVTVIGALIAQEHRVTKLEDGQVLLKTIASQQAELLKDLEGRVTRDEGIIKTVSESQARIITLEEIWLKRHEQEDNARFHQLGIPKKQ